MGRQMKVVIGIGDPGRRDDGVGPALAGRLTKIGLPGVDVRVLDGEPAGLLDAWAGARLAIVVDAIIHKPARPGQIHRNLISAKTPTSDAHGRGVPEAVELGRAQDRLPDRLIVYAVEAANVGEGTELSPAVAGALPELLDAILTDLGG